MGKKNKNLAGLDEVESAFYYPFWERKGRAANTADMTVQFIRNMLERIATELCINRFNWQGLPESIDTRYLEKTLFFRGLVVVFQDRNTGKLFAMAGTPVGGYDINENPLAYRVQGTGTTSPFNGLVLSARNVVPIWANALRIPDYDIVSFYSNRIANTERTIDINLQSARRNKVLAYNENMRLSAENINAALDRGDASISVNSNSSIAIKDLLQTLDLGVQPKQIEELSVVRDRFWNNFMGLLGINNANQDKKERLVASEVEGNDDQIGNFRRINLNWRQKAAEQINKKWPDALDSPVEVDYHTDINADRPVFPDEMEGGDPVGNVHA